MNGKIKIDPYKIHLESVRVTSGSINSDSNIEKDQILEFKTGFDVSYGVAPDTSSVQFIFSVKLDGIDLKRDLLPINAQYTIETIFKIDNLNSFIELKDGIVLIDQMMVGTLMGIVYSTTRGIILTRTQGTIIDGVLLPIIDPLELINKKLD